MHQNPGRLNLQVKLRVRGPSAGIDYLGLGSLRMYISNKLPGAAAIRDRTLQNAEAHLCT